MRLCLTNLKLCPEPPAISTRIALPASNSLDRIERSGGNAIEIKPLPDE
jgi:hypothetical protein